MERSRCPNCICHEGNVSVPRKRYTVYELHRVSLRNFLDILDEMHITFDPEGTQEIVLSWDLREVCQYVRRSIQKRLEANRSQIQKMLSEVDY